MAERKVLNKYYPQDFNPAKLPRRRQPNNQQINVRMMLPMSIRCNRCGNYMYKGTKFNSNKEKVIGETYLGIHIYRFYFKCTNCCSEITMKTDPHNSDYVVESGPSRNFEPWRTEETDADKQRRDADQEIGDDAMKSLEKHTVDSKREIDNLAALDEIKSIKSRHTTVSADAMLQALQRRSEVAIKAEEDKLVQDDEEAVIGSIFQGSQVYVKRICDDKDLAESPVDNGESSNNTCKKRKVSEKSTGGNPTDHHLTTNINILDSCKSKLDDEPGGGSTFTFKTSTVKVLVKKKQPQLVSDDNKDENSTQSIGLQSLCQQYDSSDE